MKKNNRAIKRAKQKKVKMLFLIIILGYVLFSIVFLFLKNNSKRYTVINGTIEKTINTEAIIFRNEKVFNSEDNGKIKRFSNEGDKVATGSKIAEIISKDSNNISEEINEIDNEISKLNSNKLNSNIFKEDIKKSEGTLNNITNEIQLLVVGEEYDSIPEVKQQLLQLVNKHNLILGENNLKIERINKLNEKKDKLTQEIKSKTNIYLSDSSGIISYRVDGYEDLYSFESITNIDCNILNSIKPDEISVKDLNSTKVGQPLFKIIDNSKWYAVTKLENNSINKLVEGKNLSIRINDNKESIKGNIKKINTGEEESVVIIEFSSHLYKYYDIRNTTLEIILNTSKGLKIPNKAITKRDGIEGVYIKNLNNFNKFRPINIIDKDENYTIVEEGSNGYIEIEKPDGKKKEKSILIYDEIILNWSRIKLDDL